MALHTASSAVIRKLDDVAEEALAASNSEQEEEEMFFSIFLCFVILIGGTLIVYALRRRNLSWFPEAWVFYFIGLSVAIILRVTHDTKLHSVMSMLNDSFSSMFFVMLLPPIIFESGYSMDKGPFFANFGAICVFAFLGTFFSTVVVGLITYGCGAAGMMYAWSLKESLIFGSLVSATDPVTVLAVFQALGVNRRLYALVFGESVLNDAVAIVLFHVVLQFQDDFTFGDVLVGVVFFLVDFLGSLFIGLVVGFAGALLFKYTDMGHPSLVNLERSLTVLIPFVAYMLAQGFELSGVVAILFAGITSAHYTIKNLSHSARRFSLHFYKMLATVCEALVFVYIGVASPELIHYFAYWPALVLTFIAVLVGRLANVGIGTWLVNRFRTGGDKVTQKEQFVLWFSGLRGGVAFALATGTQSVLTNKESAGLIEASCLFFVVVSIFTIGGSIGPLARHLDVCSDGNTIDARRRRARLRRRKRWRRRVRGRRSAPGASTTAAATAGDDSDGVHGGGGSGGDGGSPGHGGAAVGHASATHTASDGMDSAASRRRRRRHHRRDRQPRPDEDDGTLPDLEAGVEMVPQGGGTAQVGSPRRFGDRVAAAVTGVVTSIRTAVSSSTLGVRTVGAGPQYTHVNRFPVAASTNSESELSPGAQRVGRGAGSSGEHADAAAAGDPAVLRRDGTTTAGGCINGVSAGQATPRPRTVDSGRATRRIHIRSQPVCDDTDDGAAGTASTGHLQPPTAGANGDSGGAVAEEVDPAANSGAAVDAGGLEVGHTPVDAAAVGGGAAEGVIGATAVASAEAAARAAPAATPRPVTQASAPAQPPPAIETPSHIGLRVGGTYMTPIPSEDGFIMVEATVRPPVAAAAVPPANVTRGNSVLHALRSHSISSWRELDAQVLTPLFTTSPPGGDAGSNNRLDAHEEGGDVSVSEVGDTSDLPTPSQHHSHPLSPHGRGVDATQPHGHSPSLQAAGSGFEGDTDDERDSSFVVSSPERLKPNTRLLDESGRV